MHSASKWLPGWGTDPDTFGAWGQWAGAIGSFLAVVVALGLAVLDGRRRARELADRRAAQARTITAIVETVTVGLAHPVRQPAVVVKNHGQLPITDIWVFRVGASDFIGLLKEWEFRGKEPHVGQSPYLLSSVIGPGERGVSPWLVFADLADGDAVDSRSTSVEFEFVDAEGFRWRREDNGPPIRVLSKTDHERVERQEFKQVFSMVAAIMAVLAFLIMFGSETIRTVAGWVMLIFPLPFQMIAWKVLSRIRNR